MQSDPYLSLENEVRKLERAWDRASVEGNSAAALCIDERLFTILQVQEATRPTTARGAALVLHDALFLLQEREELSLSDHYIIRHLRPMIRRFKRNERRLDDLMTLRVLLEMARKEYGSLDPYHTDGSYEAEYRAQFGKLPHWIEKALHGAAAPVLASTSSPGKSTPRSD